MKRASALLFLAALLLAGVSASKSTPSASEALDPPELRTVILVRHAEKQPDGTSDPELSPAGLERARALARLLAAAPVESLWASEFRRTRATLAPLAEAGGLELRGYSARDPATLVKELRSDAAGALAVVAGHSNTVPDLVRRLGGEAGQGNLADDEYDRLFILTWGPGPDGEAPPVSTLELRYGD